MTEQLIIPSRSADTRSLHRVQRVLRGMIWFGLFGLFVIITGVLGLIVSALNDFLGSWWWS